MILNRLLRLFSPLSRSLSTLTQPPTLFDPDISQPDNEEDDAVKYNLQPMNPNDYLDVVTIYNRIIQREPIRPKNYKFSPNRVNSIQMCIKILLILLFFRNFPGPHTKQILSSPLHTCTILCQKSSSIISWKEEISPKLSVSSPRL